MVNKYPQILTYSIEDNLAPTIDFFQFGMGEVTVSKREEASRAIVFLFVVYMRHPLLLFPHLCLCGTRTSLRLLLDDHRSADVRAD